MSASGDKNSDIMSIPGPEDVIDPATFEQILEMDDDEEERDFSKSLVYDFFGQADSTFKKMDTSLADVRKAEPQDKGNELKKLGELGHFLKGSSATLGLTKVKDSCEKIQNFGMLKDESGLTSITADVSHEKLVITIEEAKNEFNEARDILKKFYKDDS